MANSRLPALLSFNGGFVDTAGFLALHGLFTAHVTGNFVNFGAALALGRSGVIAKLLALPVFCAVVLAVRLFDSALMAGVGRLLIIQTALLSFAAIVLISFGPFAEGDAPLAILGGMLLVAAMAVQNALQRIHFTALPPSTLMTGTTTQIMLDLADRLRSSATPEASLRTTRLAVSLLSFACGCLLAALAYMNVGEWCFLLPPLISAGVLAARD